MTELLRNAWKFYQMIHRYWSDEIEEKMGMYPYWSANKWTDVLSKGGGQEKRFQYCLKPICPEKLLYTFEPFKIIQEKLILEMLASMLHCKTVYCYQRILPRTFITSETERDSDQ